MPEDVPTVQRAIAQARPGDTILLAAGTYPGGYVVPRAKRDLTIRGVDRNDVVLGGANKRRNGIVVHADGVSILNMSAHDFRENAFYWEGADRFRASYLTVWNVGEYGIYVEDGERGVVDHAYVSGAARARPLLVTTFRTIVAFACGGSASFAYVLGTIPAPFRSQTESRITTPVAFVPEYPTAESRATTRVIVASHGLHSPT